MGVKVIPEQKIVTCDSCGADFKNKAHSYSGRVSYTCDGLDFQGHAVGQGDNRSYIFCDECYFRVTKALKESLKAQP
jgi:hypothetical protein